MQRQQRIHSAFGPLISCALLLFSRAFAQWTPPPAAQLWSPSGAPSGYNWSGIACSADGAKLVAIGGFGGNLAGIYTSPDGGASWTQTSAPSNLWMAVASSSDGTKLAAAEEYNNGGAIFVSADSGATWTMTSAQGIPWSAVASSTNGSVLIAGTLSESSYTTFAVSTNSGATWRYTIGATNAQEVGAFWPSVACSTDGSKLFAVQLNTMSLGQVILSTNYGVSWNAITDMDQFRSVACSADGMKLAATCYQNSVYTSTNGGATWHEFEPGDINPLYDIWTWNVLWQIYYGGIASSADGSVLLAGGSTGIFVSTNSGASWQHANSIAWTNGSFGAYEYSFAVSADGNKWFMAAYQGTSTWPGEEQQGIWMVTNAVNWATKIVSLSGNLAFGNVIIGSTAQSTLSISNSGNATLTVSGISYPAGFSGAWSGTVPAGGSTNVTVTFAPTANTAYGGYITVNSDATSGTNTIAVTGAGVPVIISLSGNLAFGNVIVGSTPQNTLTISNTGFATMTVSGITYPPGFSGAWSGTIAAGASASVMVTFAPTAVTTYGGNITVNSDATTGINAITASGAGMPLTLNMGFGTNALSGSKVLVISWPAAVNGTLQQNYNLTTTNWTSAACTISVAGNSVQATVPMQTAVCFYRLVCP
jgi:hypothetical protein